MNGINELVVRGDTCEMILPSDEYTVRDERSIGSTCSLDLNCPPESHDWRGESLGV